MRRTEVWINEIQTKTVEENEQVSAIGIRCANRERNEHA